MPLPCPTSPKNPTDDGKMPTFCSFSFTNPRQPEVISPIAHMYTPGSACRSSGRQQHGCVIHVLRLCGVRTAGLADVQNRHRTCPIGLFIALRKRTFSAVMRRRERLALHTICVGAAHWSVSPNPRRCQCELLASTCGFGPLQWMRNWRPLRGTSKDVRATFSICQVRVE